MNPTVVLVLAYIVLMLAMRIISAWTWNRAMAMSGKVSNEPGDMDNLFALAVIGTVWALKTILA